VSELTTRLSKIASSMMANAALVNDSDGISVGDVREIMRLLADREGWVRAAHDPTRARAILAAPACTGTTAVWCPVHGDCACPRDAADERTLDDARCSLHSPTSTHGDATSFPPTGHAGLDGAASGRVTPGSAAHVETPPASVGGTIPADIAAAIRERDDARAEADAAADVALELANALSREHDRNTNAIGDCEGCAVCALLERARRWAR
jgi:hypothetical protein